MGHIRSRLYDAVSGHVESLSQSVIKILTLHRVTKIFFQKYHKKAEILSFPTMYIKGGVFLWSKLVKTRILSKKLPQKQLFRADTNLDQVTLSSHNSCSKPPNLKNCYIGKLSTSAFRLAIGKPAGVNIVRTAGRYFAQGGRTRKIAKKYIFCFFRFSSKIL